jgi:hypothetical protein
MKYDHLRLHSVTKNFLQKSVVNAALHDVTVIFYANTIYILMGALLVWYPELIVMVTSLRSPFVELFLVVFLVLAKVKE